MGEGRLCFGSAGNSESGYTKKWSFCFVDFVTVLLCVYLYCGNKEQCVSCMVEVSKLKRGLKFYHMYILNLQVYINLHFVLLVRNSI